MIWVAIGLTSIWLLLLSLLVAGLVRHMATLELASKAGAVPRMQLDFDSDGPEVGSVIPFAVLDILTERLGRVLDDQVIFVFSPGCGTCLEMASEIIRWPSLAARGAFVVRGPTTGGAADELRGILQRAGTPLVDGEDARTMMRELNVNSVPFAISVTGSKVAHKKYLRRAVHLAEFRVGHEAIDGLQAVPTTA